MRGATVVAWAVCLSTPFQLPYPVRDATVQDKQLAVIWAISTPTPVAGVYIVEFQLTHPARGATVKRHLHSQSQSIISIPAPCEWVRRI